MIALEEKQTIPITVEEDGSWKVTGTRVTVEVLIEQFKRGSTPEQILDDFPTVPLASIYEIIGYYLSNQQIVEEYITNRGIEAKEIQSKFEDQPGMENIRKKISNARDRLAAKVT